MFQGLLFSKDNPTGHSERAKKKRQTDEQDTVKEQRKEADRRKVGKTISKSDQDWTLSTQLGQLKTGQERTGLLRTHLWCPDDLPRLWDRIKQ